MDGNRFLAGGATGKEDVDDDGVVSPISPSLHLLDKFEENMMKDGVDQS